jgi:hypothetical protein
VITSFAVRSLWITWIAGFAGFASFVTSAAASPEPLALEYKVKAGYLYNFARFVQWPETAFAAPNSPLVIGVLDAREAVVVVQELLDARLVDGRSINVRAVTPEQIPGSLHILLVTRAARKTPGEISALIGSAPILLVGETELFAERGGTLGFVRDGETIRINLNLERAAEAGLKVSSKLSSVARVVRSPRPVATQP